MISRRQSARHRRATVRALYHHEEDHNVYLSVILNAGWLGGGVNWIMILLTLVLGFQHLIRAVTRPPFLIA